MIYLTSCNISHITAIVTVNVYVTVTATVTISVTVILNVSCPSSDECIFSSTDCHGTSVL